MDEKFVKIGWGRWWKKCVKSGRKSDQKLGVKMREKVMAKVVEKNMSKNSVKAVYIVVENKQKTREKLSKMWKWAEKLGEIIGWKMIEKVVKEWV